MAAPSDAAPSRPSTPWNGRGWRGRGLIRNVGRVCFGGGRYDRTFRCCPSSPSRPTVLMRPPGSPPSARHLESSSTLRAQHASSFPPSVRVGGRLRRSRPSVPLLSTGGCASEPPPRNSQVQGATRDPSGGRDAKPEFSGLLTSGVHAIGQESQGCNRSCSWGMEWGGRRPPLSLDAHKAGLRLGGAGWGWGGSGEQGGAGLA